MHELGFENHINDFEFFHNLQHENNICNRERRSSFNTKVPTLKAEIETINKKKKELKRQVEDINDKFVLIINKIKFNNEKTIFNKLKPELLKKKEYINKFVAIHNGEIVGFSDNKIELMKKIYREIGYVPLYIDKITKEKTVYKLSSPKEIR